MSVDLGLDLLNVLPEPTCLITGEGSIVAANPLLTQILALTQESLSGKALCELVTNPRAEVMHYLRACAGSRHRVLGSLTWRTASGQGTSYRCEGVVVRPWSHDVPALLLLRLAPERAAANQFLLLNQQIERLGAEIRERHAIEAALQASEANYRALFEAASDGIFIANEQGIYVDVNAIACQVAGYTREELLGKHLRDLTPPPDWPRLDANRAVLLAGASQISEWTLLRKDGTSLPIEVSAKQLPDGRWQAFVRDITTRKRTETALHQLNATLEQRVAERTAELDRFAYIASHDLRSPLRAIDQLASWISQDASASLPPSSQVHLQKLRGRIKRMETLLQDLLAYSRAGRQYHAFERIDLVTLVHNITELLALPAGFGVTLVEELPPFVAERVPLETVLRNLIGNALKHHDHPEVGHVQVTARAGEHWLVFAVSDNGPGIDPAFHTRIFDLFQTLKPRDQLEGSGMGLAVVKKLVESRGGTIEVSSSIGQGATFHFTWPKTFS